MSNIATPRPEMAGVRPAVLLLHGMLSSFDHGWRRLGWVDVLEDGGREVLGRDLLGHGDSARFYQPDEYADFEEHAFEPALGHTQVDAVGFSMGALTLLRLAADDVTRFRRLAVLGVGDPVLRLAEPRAERPLPDVLGALAQGTLRQDGDSAVFRQLASADRSDPEALVALLRRPQRPLTVADLHRVTCPTLLVIGTEDFAWPADRLAAELPDARVVELPGVDHFATPSSMKAMDAVVSFLEHD